ncbi:MAG: CDP-alcohol phosphatidyltransferase family protein [Candidatus Zixiibacteriota bacterium]
MSIKLDIKAGELFLLPNIMSLLRVVLTIPIAWFLAQNNDAGALIAAGLLLVAGATDFLDGFLARKLNQITALGHLLDPLADKLLAIILIVELIIFRDFPIWLAVAIVLRDIVILTAGLKIMKGRHEIAASSLSGKYYFTSLAVLLGSYILRFDFGINLFFWIVIIFFAMSSINYGRRFFALMHDKEIPRFKDRPAYIRLRAFLNLCVWFTFLYRLYTDILSKYIDII